MRKPLRVRWRPGISSLTLKATRPASSIDINVICNPICGEAFQTLLEKIREVLKISFGKDKESVDMAPFGKDKESVQ